MSLQDLKMVQVLWAGSTYITSSGVSMVEPKDCFCKETVVLDLFQVIRLMEGKYASDPAKPGMVIHDMFLCDIWPSWMDWLRNDTYWHLRRSWIPTDGGKLCWDLMCMELGIDQSDEYMVIAFWVSW